MEYRRLGNSGLVVSTVGLGTNNFGQRIDFERTRGVMERALERGITFIDTADVYGGTRSEEFIGQCLPRGKRHQVVIASKFAIAMGESPYQQGTSRRYVMTAVEDSLRRLGTDYLDLYQVHRPDPRTPIVETLQALDDLVRQGKVRYVGHSNFAAWQIVDAQWTARTEHLARPISAQHEYNILSRGVEEEILPACAAMGLGMIPYSPLAAGLLTGKYRKDSLPQGARLTLASARQSEYWLTDENFARVEKLRHFADERGLSTTDVAVGWLLAHQEVASVIAGATSPEQVDANIKAGEYHPSPADMELLAAI